MARNRTYNKRSATLVVVVLMLTTAALGLRLGYLMICKSDKYAKAAEELHERERPIKAERGLIYDRNGNVIATNKPVCTISVIHSQIKEPERVIDVLTKELGLSEEKVRKRVEKYSSIERIKANVDKEIADRIREYELDGVMVDEDYKRYYPYDNLASKVIGFTGSDNQGIIGLEVQYDKYLQGIEGKILTLTTAYGVEIPNAAEGRIEPIKGNSLRVSIDMNIQEYAEQLALKVQEQKSANSVSIIVMNPKTGELYAMVNTPEFNLNEPYVIIDEVRKDKDLSLLNSEQKNALLNQMWRNPIISDTYEPGSTFKVITATAALEKGVVTLNDGFYCPGYKKVEDRIIRCHKAGGHGSETFVEGIKNSCNPVFMELGARVGAEDMYYYFRRLGLFGKTGVDLPGEAASIMHKIENIKPVELATISFGQSFQITPLHLLSAVSSIVNGGTYVTPHFGVEILNENGEVVKTLEYKKREEVISKKTSDTMKQLLEAVVASGSGKNAYLPGFRIGGKTATSEKLPRSANKYISSFLGVAPANDPEIIALVMIDEPVGIYYGGTIAAPVVRELFANILPYMGIQPEYTNEEEKKFDIGTIKVPSFIGKTKEEVEKLLKIYQFKEVDYCGEGNVVKEQYPLEGDEVNLNSDLILYLE